MAECANSSLTKLSVNVHGSLGGYVADVGCTSHLWFKSHSVGVVNYVHAIRESFLLQKRPTIWYSWQCTPWCLIIQGKWGGDVDSNIW